MTPRHDSDEDDVDAAFAALIGANFPGEDARPRRGPRAPLVPTPKPVDAPRVDEPLTILDRMDLADAADDEGWTPPAPRPMGPWSFPVALAAAGLVLGVLVGIVGLVGADVPRWLGTLGAVFAVAGLAGLMSAALRRRGGPPDDDGAVV